MTGKLRQNHGRGSGTILANSAYGYSQKGAHMRAKLRKILRKSTSPYSGIVGEGTSCRKMTSSLTDEEFNAEQTMTA
ncbi:hypothetical protein KCP73_00735 [Salmonella enterica subsp. enterica]|nr:hypothetical protein KCP73_00735 [Salmonella enterica subsp. enterica]